MALDSFGSKNQFFPSFAFMCVSQFAKKAINWQKKGAQQEMEMKEISSPGFGVHFLFALFFVFAR